ncbi:hypothetical protein AN2353V1_3831 [Citrobacter koseri]|nr:hypothetical protein AN2353V1_3831 [Citrobacter koseri]CAH6172035.1 hypothetical protein AN2353V1_3831 [Citrobacter koseri]
MGTPRFTPEFKEEAVRQITERDYPAFNTCSEGRKGLTQIKTIHRLHSRMKKDEQ